MKATKVSKKDVQVNLNSYQSSHGKMPKGKGPWCFSIYSYCPNINDCKFFDGNYSDAKKQAITWAAELGFHTIYLQS